MLTIRSDDFSNKELPKDWTVSTLGSIARITSGGTPDRTIKEYWNGYIPWVTTSKIDFSLIQEVEECITDKGLNNSAAKVFPKGTILMAMYGQGATRGRVGMLGLAAATNQACAALIVEPHKALNEFIFYYLSFIYRHIRELGHGGNQKNLNTGLIKNIAILLPSLHEQRHIVKILTTWDQAIDLTTQLIAAKQQRKRGLMQQLLTGKRRFQEYINIPWQSLRAGDIFQPNSKRNNVEEELLSVTQDRGVIPRSMLETRVVMPGGETTSYKLVEVGDFIISLRSFQGGIEYSEYQGLVSPAYTVLKPKRPIVDSFYKHLFKSQNFISRLGVAIIGIRDGKQINFEDFATIRLAYPELDEQKRIAEVLDACDQELVLLNRKLALLKKQKQGLMQQLLTGKIRVKT